MKGPFGMLLIGGGIILLIGLFTGKIVFGSGTGTSPLDPNAPSGIVINGKQLTNAQWQKIAGQNGV